MPTNDVNIGFVLGLPPEKAITYFKSKGNKITWDWHEMLNDAHQKAFTVAKITKADILQDIRNEITKAINGDIGWEEFKNNLVPTLQKKGWWGKQEIIDENGNEKTVQLGSERRLQLIYDTNLQIAFSQGTYQAQMAAMAIAPYGQYVTKEDNRVRPSHALLDKKVYRLDDPFWDHFYPPNGFRCRCKVRTLTKRQVEKQGLTVDSAVGKIRSTQRNIGDKQVFNSSLTVETQKGRRNVSPDLGWDYNPAKGYFDLKQQNYDDSIFDKLSRDVGRKFSANIISKDIKNAEKFAEYHITNFANYEGFDLETANQVNNHLKKRLEELNYLPSKLNSITAKEKQSIMSIFPNSDLEFNKKFITVDSYQKLYKRAINAPELYLFQYFSENDAITAAIDHELGHLVQNQLWGVFAETDRKKISTWISQIIIAEKQNWRLPTKYAREGNLKKYESKSDIILSQYREAFSECFCLYVNDKMPVLNKNIIDFFNNLNLYKDQQ